MILIGKETKEDGNTVYDIRGLMVEPFLLSVEKMNMTVIFLEPSLQISFEAAMREYSRLTSGMADVLVGIVPLLPIIFGTSEPSIPYISGPVKWFVPCSKPISRVDRFVTVFDASVWLMMITVFVLTSALFWFSANYPDRTVEIDFKTLLTILNVCIMRGVFLLGYPFLRCLDLGN